jgi:hypothetical protein
MAANEDVLQGRAKAIGDHRVEAGFCAKPTNTKNASPFTEFVVDMKLVL